MKITVLGKSPAWQDAGGACSGYLIEEEGATLLLDCGSGVFAKLREVRDYTKVEAVLLSHLHADHMLDLVPYAYALLLSPRQQPAPVAGHPGSRRPARPRLIAPPGAEETFRRLTGSWGNETLISDGFELEEYDATSTVEVGPLRARFRQVPHHVTSHAVSLSSDRGGGRLVFSGDSRPSEDLVEAARDADLFIVEATLPRPERTGVRGHLTAAEAGDHARRARAKRVVLTHISDELESERVAAEAAAAYGGPVEVAREGAVYEL
jgi:ribonuclease BN (tRNA processing enzyme)